MLRPNERHGAARICIAEVRAGLMLCDSFREIVSSRAADIVRVIGAAQNVDKCAGSFLAVHPSRLASLAPQDDGLRVWRKCLQRLQMPDRPARRDGLCGGHNRIRIDTIVLVEVGNRTGLAEMLDTERAGA